MPECVQCQNRGTEVDALLAQLLPVAVEAALAAGELLREEFHRPGGPRSDHPHHAAIDTEAERLIRDRLLAAAPDFGYLGEELGSHGAAPGRDVPLWIVDPNDGTSDYLKGLRGASVSIGLLLDGAPVLGVVHAPNAPDDEGDLFTAIAGQPAQRNGKPLEPLRTVSAGELSVVLCAASADRAAEANARLFAPCRFRGVPSVAYRLALLAAGEGDFALSLGGTNYWDFAGGHAILRGAGAELFTDRAAPVRYPFDGRGRCGGAIFAGHPEFVAGFYKPELHRPPKPVLPRPPRASHVREAGLLRRAQGCLLGQFCGDALGAQVEFETHPPRVTELTGGGPFQWSAGQPTDDSEMALSLARCLAHERRFDADRVLEAYRRWQATSPPDIGSTTAQGLSGHPNAESQANGSLMRISPLSIFCAGGEPELAAALAAQDASLTHPHPVCVSCTAVYADAVAFAIASGASPFEVFRRALNTAAALGVPPEVFEALQRAEYEPAPGFHARMGWVLIAFQNAFHRLLAHRSAEEAIIETVAQGGDTDTNGAICGALLGAVHGRDSLPVRWRRMVLTSRDPRRPDWLWPADALTLAERLLTAGAGSK